MVVLALLAVNALLLDVVIKVFETDLLVFSNTELAGISAKSVKDKPTFPLVWEEIKDIMGSGLLIAHNAQFDMSVLAKTING